MTEQFMWDTFGQMLHIDIDLWADEPLLKEVATEDYVVAGRGAVRFHANCLRKCHQSGTSSQV